MTNRNTLEKNTAGHVIGNVRVMLFAAFLRCRNLSAYFRKIVLDECRGFQMTQLKKCGLEFLRIHFLPLLVVDLCLSKTVVSFGGMILVLEQKVFSSVNCTFSNVIYVPVFILEWCRVCTKLCLNSALYFSVRSGKKKVGSSFLQRMTQCTLHNSTCRTSKVSALLKDISRGQTARCRKKR